MVEAVGIGALNWDRLFLVDRIAAAGEEIVIRDVREEAGGSAANTIAALGRLGVSCGFVGKIGTDDEGRRIVEAFEREGVDTAGIVTDEGGTGRVLAFVDEAGERSMYVDPGVNDDLLLGDVNRDSLASAGHVHVSSFAGETSIETIKAVPKIIGSANLSFAPGFLSFRGMDFLMPLLKSCDTIFLNEKEAAALTGESAVNAGRVLRGAGAKRVVVTLGNRGCIVSNESGARRVGGMKVRALDTTGAGDAFSGGFLYGAIKGFDDLDCAQIGNFVASRCIQKIGAREGLPSPDSLKNFLEDLP